MYRTDEWKFIKGRARKKTTIEERLELADDSVPDWTDVMVHTTGFIPRPFSPQHLSLEMRSTVQ